MWNYVVAHWRGQLGLLKSSLLNGVAVYCLLLVLVLVIVKSGGADSPILVYGGAGVFLLWGIWAVVGIFRCGVRNVFDRANTKIGRIGGAMAIAGVVVVGWFMAKDVYYLFIRPLF